MTEAIRHERQVELVFEMHRYFDLVRWGIAAQKMPEFKVGKHEVFPLPQIEMDLNPSLSTESELLKKIIKTHSHIGHISFVIKK